MPKSASQAAGLAAIFDRLDKFYRLPALKGKPKPPQPTDPYEMLLHRNCGYPQSDERCDKGFRALKKEIGLAPQKILDAPDAKLREVMRPSVMKPELTAFRLKEIAARVLDEFSGDMRAVLKRPLPEAKKALKKFPTVGDSTAEKILLFTRTAPVAAIPRTPFTPRFASSAVILIGRARNGTPLIGSRRAPCATPFRKTLTRSFAPFSSSNITPAKSAKPRILSAANVLSLPRVRISKNPRAPLALSSA